MEVQYFEDDQGRQPAKEFIDGLDPKMRAKVFGRDVYKRQGRDDGHHGPNSQQGAPRCQQRIPHRQRHSHQTLICLLYTSRCV